MTRFLVSGVGGQLGQQLVEDARAAGHEAVGFDRHSSPPGDVTDPGALRHLVRRSAPDVIVHAAAWTAVDACETDPHRAHQVNVAGTRRVVEAADLVGAHVVYVSTDYVFDGTKTAPYVETDVANPLSTYGHTKLAGEGQLRPTDTIVRTSWLSGEHGTNVVQTILRLARGHRPLRFVDDRFGHPTFTGDLSPVLLGLGEDCAAGTFHVTNQGVVSWHAFAQEVLEAAGFDPAQVLPVSTEALGHRRARRPANSVLGTEVMAGGRYGLLRHHRAPLQELVDRLAAHPDPEPGSARPGRLI